MDEKKNGLIVKIKNIEYISLERMITRETQTYRINRDLKKIGVIEQGVKKVERGGFFSSAYIILSFLVPTNKIKEFSEIMDNST